MYAKQCNVIEPSLSMCLCERVGTGRAAFRGGARGATASQRRQGHARVIESSSGAPRVKETKMQPWYRERALAIRGEKIEFHVNLPPNVPRDRGTARAARVRRARFVIVSRLALPRNQTIFSSSSSFPPGTDFPAQIARRDQARFGVLLFSFFNLPIRKDESVEGQ